MTVTRTAKRVAPGATEHMRTAPDTTKATARATVNTLSASNAPSCAAMRRTAHVTTATACVAGSKKRIHPRISDFRNSASVVVSLNRRARRQPGLSSSSRGTFMSTRSARNARLASDNAASASPSSGDSANDSATATELKPGRCRNPSFEALADALSGGRRRSARLTARKASASRVPLRDPFVTLGATWGCRISNTPRAQHRWSSSHSPRGTFTTAKVALMLAATSCETNACARGHCASTNCTSASTLRTHTPAQTMSRASGRASSGGTATSVSSPPASTPPAPP
mmetsp:Transcript_12717/g.39537  ORF Transcript_12717/g.39537 Transcript_12717/m.39537 type:complete len:285 (-) Transcript_12717:483-1337(-)